MSTIKKPPGSIHRIREFELEKIHLSDEFDILQIVGEGWFGKILLVEHRATDTEMVLKALPKPYVSLRDFYREFHYGLHLGIHKNIVTTYDVAFETAGFYVFTQEYAPLGDLTSNVSESGIGELHSKRVAKQIASALDYMHSKEIVHRDVKLDNVLIYKSDFSRVKLCDFGESYKSGSVVERQNEWLPYSPPEVLQIKTEGTYKADPSHDVWQFAIVIFVCLTGCLPWQKAASDDPRYVRYIAWHSTNMVLPLRRTPKLFKLLSSKGSKMFRRFLEPRPLRRPKDLSDLSKFVDDRWLAKGAEKDMAENEQDELCPSMYSFHSSPEEKNKLLSTLAEYGIETTVDRIAKKNRIRDWIESSVITEEDEEDDSGTATPSSSVSREPIPGHISSVRAKETAAKSDKKINTTLKDASHKHFNPRTGDLQNGPSEMGGAAAVIESSSLTSMAAVNGKHGSFDSGSVVTLASRNDLILSEGHSYHSDTNLDMIGDDDGDAFNIVDEVNTRNTSSSSSMVNSIGLNKYNNNSLSATSMLYNNRINSFSMNSTSKAAAPTAFTNQPLNVRANMLSRNGTEPLSQQWYSSTALNVNNSDRLNNLTASTTSGTGLITAFKSIATISVPSNSASSNQRLQSIQDSGYGSFDKIRPIPTFRIGSPPIEVGNKAKLSGDFEAMQMSRRGTQTDSKVGAKKSQSFSQTEVSASMKDTPYDRIKINK